MNRLLLTLTLFFSAAASAVPVYRYWNGRFHFYSTEANQGYNGYQLEGEVFQVHRRHEGNRVGLHRCLIRGAGIEFLSTDRYCEGQQFVSLLGFIDRGPTHGAGSPLYRCYQPQVGDHINTKLVNECYAAGYQVEGVVGYVR